MPANILVVEDNRDQRDFLELLLMAAIKVLLD